jgi:hypothetical protein
MASGLLTSSWDVENFYETTLSADMTAGTLEAFLTTVPVGDEGTLVIDPDSPTSREIIYYTSKTALKVNIHASGRGYDSTTATSHTAGTRVIMAPIADWFNSLRTLFTTTPASWTNLGYAPNTVTANGNRSYDVVFNGVDLTSTLSAGMRLRTTRTVAAPTQSTSLNGTTQYYSKSSPNKLTFTDDFVVSAWLKPSAYQTGMIASRFDGTSGWQVYMQSDGTVRLQAFNAGSGNYSMVTSYQSLPLNKWTHVTIQLDMSAFTATTTTSYIMFDGVDVPATVARAGTNPTALVQAGNLLIGADRVPSNYFAGKLAQVAIYSAKVTQATIKASMNQTLSGSETSLASAYSFSAGVITDLNTTTPNDLTANGSAVATNADSPFGGQADGTISSTLDYAIVTKTAFSTNTTLTVQVPEGCTIPTSGGVSAVVYSSNKAPYGMPIQRGKWLVEFLSLATQSQASAAINTWYNIGFPQLNLPVGAWVATYKVNFYVNNPASSGASGLVSLSTSASTESDATMSSQAFNNGVSTVSNMVPINNTRDYLLSAATTYYLIGKTDNGGTPTLHFYGISGATRIFAENAYL